MTTSEKWILTIVIIIIVVISVIYWKTIQAFWNSLTASKEGSACVTSGALPHLDGTIVNGVCTPTPAANTNTQTLTEGAACVTGLGAAGIITNGICVIQTTEGSPCATPGYFGGTNGTIQNGACVANNSQNNNSSGTPPNIVAKNYKLQIANTSGAKVYTFVNGQFVASNTLLQYGAAITSNAYVAAPAIYFQSGNGWVLGTDVSIIGIF